MPKAIFTLAALFLFCGIQVTAAKTPVSNDQANAFYKNCLTQGDLQLSKDSLEALCSCTVVEMQKNMSIEDTKILGEKTPRGRAMLSYMLLRVYAPCIAYPARDLVYRNCFADAAIDALELKSDREHLCNCMADRTGLWLSKEGRDIMSDILLTNPPLTDPIALVIESDTFGKESYKNLVACLVQ